MDFRGKDAARNLGIEVAKLEVQRTEDIAPAFEALQRQADALYVVGTFISMILGLDRLGIYGLWLCLRSRPWWPNPTHMASASRARRYCSESSRIVAVHLQSAQEPIGGTAAQFARLVRDDYDKYARLVRELDIKIN